MKPRMSILNSSFKYRDSAHTSVAATWERYRRAQRKAAPAKGAEASSPEPRSDATQANVACTAPVAAPRIRRVA
jgi:hypothetical protein